MLRWRATKGAQVTANSKRRIKDQKRKKKSSKDRMVQSKPRATHGDGEAQF